MFLPSLKRVCSMDFSTWISFFFFLYSLSKPFPVTPKSATLLWGPINRKASRKQKAKTCLLKGLPVTLPPGQADANMSERGVSEWVSRRILLWWDQLQQWDNKGRWPASSFWGINWAREVEIEAHVNKMENTKKILSFLYFIAKR